MKALFSFVLAAAWIAADYFSKHWALETLSNQSITVNSVMNFRLAFNTGAAFSFLAGESGWQKWLFAGLAVVVALWIVYVLIAERLDGLSRFGYASILGGALGNLYDRLAYGHVIDFIQWHYHDYYWPIFNIADAAITIGVIAIILAGLHHWFYHNKSLN